MAKKTKRKIAHPKLPMQRQLNLQHEGKYFDLRAIFDRLNARHFRGRLRGYKVIWGRRRKRRPKEYFIFGTIQEEDRIIRINPLLGSAFRSALVSPIRPLSRNAALGRAGRSRARAAGAGFTPKNSISANASSRAIGGRAVGKKRISRASCASASPSARGCAAIRPGLLVRQRGCRCYVLFDEVPKGCREQEGDQLRAPVVQDQFLHLHKCLAAEFRRFACGRFPA